MTTEKKLPVLCYVIVPGAPKGKRLGIVKRGERGYYHCDFDRAYSDGSFMTDEKAQAFVTEMNTRMGVDPAEAEAMRYGSLFGWHVPAAKAEAHK